MGGSEPGRMCLFPAPNFCPLLTSSDQTYIKCEESHHFTGRITYHQTLTIAPGAPRILPRSQRSTA